MEDDRQTLQVIPLVHRLRSSRSRSRAVEPDLSHLVQDAFDQIETIFGRLILCSYLLEKETGLYVCPLVSVAFGYQPVSRSLGEMHASIVKTWLELSAEQRISDLQHYLSGTFQGDTERFLQVFESRKCGELLPVELPEQVRTDFLLATDAALRGLPLPEGSR